MIERDAGMSYANFDSLIKKVQSFQTRKRAALAAAEDEHALEAVFSAQKENIVSPVLIGNEGIIREIIGKLGEEPANCTIVNVKEGDDPARIAVGLIKNNEADFIMKGKIDTANLLKSVVDKDSGLRTGRAMSHMAFYEMPAYHKLLVVTDGGMITDPDLEQKKQIIINAVDILIRMGYENPKIAVLTAVEQVNPKMQATVDAAELKKMNMSGEISNCIIEGPISFDLAVSRESARLKGFESPYCGDFDVMIVPNIETGNILGKALIYMGRAKMAGMIVGAKIPIVLTSRGATAEEKYLSLVLSAGVSG